MKPKCAKHQFLRHLKMGKGVDRVVWLIQIWCGVPVCQLAEFFPAFFSPYKVMRRNPTMPLKGEQQTSLIRNTERNNRLTSSSRFNCERRSFLFLARAAIRVHGSTRRDETWESILYIGALFSSHSFFSKSANRSTGHRERNCYRRILLFSSDGVSKEEKI